MRRGETPRNARIFHGWWIVLVAFICHAVNTGMIFYAWGVFFRPLAEAFGGHAPVASGFSVLQFAAAGYSLLVGPRRRPPRRTPGRDRGRARAGGGLPPALARALARRALPLPRRSRRARLDLHRSAAEQLRRGALVRAPARPGARHRHRRHLRGPGRGRAPRPTPRPGLRLATRVCRARRAGGPDRPPSGAALHASRSRRPGPPAGRTRRRRPGL